MNERNPLSEYYLHTQLLKKERGLCGEERGVVFCTARSKLCDFGRLRCEVLDGERGKSHTKKSSQTKFIDRAVISTVPCVCVCEFVGVHEEEQE